MPTTIKKVLLLQSPSQLSMSPIILLFPFIWADYSTGIEISQVFPRFFRLSQRKAVKNFRPRPDCSGRVARYAIAWGGGWGFRQGTTEPSPRPWVVGWGFPQRTTEPSPCPRKWFLPKEKGDGVAVPCEGYAILWVVGWGFPQGTTEPSPCPVSRVRDMLF